MFGSIRDIFSGCFPWKLSGKFFFLYVCVVRLFVLCEKSEAYLTLKLNVDVSGGGDGVRVRSRVWILEIDAFHVVNTVFRYCISL